MRRSLLSLGLLFVAAAGAWAAESVVIDKAATQLQVVDASRDRTKPKVIVHTTMATWCVACKAELPQYSYLRSVFKPEEVAIFGLPYDEKEGADLLKAWAASNKPSYQLLTNLTKDEISSVKRMVLTTLKIDAVPATFMTDSDGRILRARLGPPSVSEIRELLRSQRERK